MTMIGKNGKKSTESKLQESLVLFIDSSSTIDDVKKFVGKKTSIITFDYESDQLLSKNNIDHEISDIYIDENDMQIIQNDSYHLANWFLEPSIRKFMEYEGINFGKLINVEFSLFLIKFLKNFLEIVEISKLYTNFKFITSPDLYEITNSLTNNVEKLNENQIAFYYDKIKINSKLGNTSFNLPYSYYVKIKDTIELILHFLFSPKKTQNHQKTNLFVEFDAIRFQKLFSLMPQNPLNGILYNRRKASIWNFRSFSIVKKSKCKIATSHDLLDNKLKSHIENEILSFEKKFEDLLKLENFFTSFFSIKNLSFWKIIKPTFIILFKKRLKENVKEIVLAKQLLEKYKFSSIVVWSEEGLTEKILINLAKSQNIPTILIQHGLFYDTPEAYNMNKFQGVFPSEVDKYIVWGKLEKEHAIKNGVSSDKIECLGNPQFDQFTHLDAHNSIGNSILIATSGSNTEEVRGLTVKAHNKSKETIKKICQIVSKTNKKIIIKLHPSPDDLDIVELKEEMDSNVSIVKAGNISSLIKSCDLMIVIDLTSVILEAQLCNKPVISVSVKNWWGVPSIFKSKFCISTNVDDLESLLDRILKDEKFREELIQNGRKFSDQYLSNQGTASQKILDFISKI